MSLRSRQVHLVARPIGEPRPSDFAVVEVDVPEPADGEVLVRSLFASVDPYMRGRMNDAKSYVPPYALGEVMDGGAVGEVVTSHSDALSAGDVVVHGLGWREHAVGPARAFRRVEPLPGVPLSAWLGVLGMPGLTAWVGLLDIASYADGETVFVSGAAGAVGSLVGQLVVARGGRAVGSAGTPDKVRWLTEEVGYDAAFDYHDGPIAASLARVAPDGVDVFFDNVGGEHLEAAIDALRPRGRIAACGAISRYNSTGPQPGPDNMFLVVGKRLTIRGFIVSDHGDRRTAFEAEVGGMLREGRLVVRETVVDGIEAMPEAFRGLLRGANTGKMVVRL